MNKKILIAVAWPYVNGDLHVGHLAGYLIPADIIARYHRLKGNDVLMVSGSDCHGTPITIEADKLGKTPSEIVDLYHKRDVELFKKYGLSYNLYTKTTNETHKRVVQELFLKLLENGHITKKEENQYYSEADKKFLPDRYVEGTCPYCGAKNQRSDQCEVCGRMIEAGAIINPVSKLTGNKVILKATEHYYLDLSSLQPEIKEYLDTRKDIWREWIFAEANGWVKEGLNERAITRDLDWGVEIPFDRIPDEMKLSDTEGKKFYVWFDAVIGYLSATIEFDEIVNQNKTLSPEDYVFNKFEGQTGNWKEFWIPENQKNTFHYYFMGQDNVVFHTIMWPGQLLGAKQNYVLPGNVAANKFMNYEGKKFSKSRGWIIDSNEIADEYGVDEVRFYVAANLPENKEGNFTWEGFEEAINNELVANLGNFVNRTLKFFESKFGGEIKSDEQISKWFGEDVFDARLPNKGNKDKSTSSRTKEQIEQSFKLQYDGSSLFGYSTLNWINKIFRDTSELLNESQIVQALNQVLTLSQYGNQLFNDKEIWNLIKTDKAQAKKEMYRLLQIVVALSILTEPFMPEASKKLRNVLGLEELNPVVDKDQWQFEEIKEFKLNSAVEILFSKIDVSAKIEQAALSKSKGLIGDIIVGKVISIEKHPNADKLLVTKISDGTNEFTVVTGAQNIKVGDMVPYLGTNKTIPGVFFRDKKRIVLKEKDLRGVISYGMILAEDEIGLSDKHEDIYILDIDEKYIGKSILEILTEDQVNQILSLQK